MSYLAHLLLGAAALLPRSVSQRLGRILGMVNFRLNTRAAQVTRTNLELCLPELQSEALVRKSLIETGMTIFETPAVWLGNLTRVDGWIAEVHNEPLLRRALADRAGLLLLLPHLGNWELFNVFFRRYGEMTALYHPPRQPYLQAVMQEIRTRHGNHMVPTDRSGLMALFRALNAGGTVVVLPDQVPAQGVFSDFFGQAALTDTLSSRLVGKTGARVLGVAVIRRPDGRFDVHVREPDKNIQNDDDETSARAINQLVESLVHLAPHQYQWEYKRFKVRPAGSRKLYRYR